MTVTPDKVAAGITAFAEAEILPALSGWQLIAAGAAVVLLGQQANAIIAALKGNKAAELLGVMDKEGNIDVDAAVDALKESVRQRGKMEIDIPLIGAFKLGEDDFESLRECINNS